MKGLINVEKKNWFRVISLESFGKNKFVLSLHLIIEQLDWNNLEVIKNIYNQQYSNSDMR